MITAINNRNNSQFGNGLPFYTKIEHQMRYNTTRPYKDGLLVSPFNRPPTFQFKVPEFFDGTVERFDSDDNVFGTVTIGTDDTFGIIRKPTGDGEYLYISVDKPTGISSPGVFYLAFRLVTDPIGEYRYYSEQWIGSNCVGQPLIA